jgi:glycosyltransferase involved in cell wall biosynthesis
MHIGLIAPPWLAVPPPAYGGTEAVLDRLARGLKNAGHEVELFTLEESTCGVRRRWWHSRAVEPIGDSVAEAAHVLAAYEELADVDLVHDHTTVGPLLARHRGGSPPVVTTIHSPFTRDARLIYREVTATVPLICISEHQRAAAPEVPVARVIHHGIDPDIFPVGPGDGGYLLFVGRMSRDKGVDRAAAIARAAGVPLRIAAKMREPAEHVYFRDHVEPLLGTEVEYLGEVPAEERLLLLQGARALLNPIRWPEPFGLVMIEALACGTPVIAEGIGAAPEIVEDGRTGFLCADEEEMVKAVGNIDQIDRADCRHAVLTRFSTERMVREHVALFEDVLHGSPTRGATDGTGLGVVWHAS